MIHISGFRKFLGVIVKFLEIVISITFITGLMLLLAFQVIRIRLHSYVEDMYNESGINRYLSSLRDSLTRKLKIKKLIEAYDSDGVKDAVIDKYLSWLKYLYRPVLFLFLLSLILLIISIFINGYYRIINGN
ncbi:MAG: hypothetical protein P8X47_11755 [Ignavibacteriaceae bacterium]|jgi:hypothetical protein